jgi:hypothetical protein
VSAQRFFLTQLATSAEYATLRCQDGVSINPSHAVDSFHNRFTQFPQISFPTHEKHCAIVGALRAIKILGVAKTRHHWKYLDAVVD